MLLDREEASLSAAVAMMSESFASGDDELFASQGLEAQVVEACRNRGLVRAVSSASNSSNSWFCKSIGRASTRFRKVVIGGSSSRSVPSLSSSEARSHSRTRQGSKRRTLPRKMSVVKLAKRSAGISAFEIVFGPEQALASGLALAAGDGAEAVEALGNRREKALLALAHPWPQAGTAAAAPDWCGSSGQGPEWRYPPSSRAPAGNACAFSGSSRRKIGMVAAAGAARIGEDKDPLVVVHEGLCLGEVGQERTVLD